MGDGLAKNYKIALTSVKNGLCSEPEKTVLTGLVESIAECKETAYHQAVRERSSAH